MQSIIQYISAEVTKIKDLMNQLMDHSDIVRWNYSQIKISGAGDYQWEELNSKGQAIQDEIVARYTRFAQLLEFLTTGFPDMQRRVLAALTQIVYSIIEQKGYSIRMNKEEQFCNARLAFERQFEVLAAAYQVTDNECLIIPDVSTILANPDFEKWKLADFEKFKIVLVPAVISEINAIVNHENVKNKVKNKVLECAKHRRLDNGIAVNAENTTYYAINLRKLESILPWLDVSNANDHIIASYFHIVKEHPHAKVILMTNDPGLRERAEFSCVTHSKPVFRKTESIPANISVGTPVNTKADKMVSKANVPNKPKAPNKKDMVKPATKPAAGRSRR